VHNYAIHDLVNMLQARTGLKHRALIERLDNSLNEKGLVRTSSTTQKVDQHLYRLTDYGFAFCQFLESYEKLKE
jgi:DNA-binding HxlR family transcriptional regulator